MTSEQFIDLCDRLEPVIGTWHPVTGRRRALTFPQAVKATVMYFKNNITQEVIGELLDVDQSTVSRAIAEIERAIVTVLADFVPDLPHEATGRVTVVDGSLLPCWSWADAQQLYSGKHKTTGHNHQFVATLDGTLLHIGDPMPGNTHDAKAIRDTGLLDILDVANTFADKGYIGTGLVTPYRKPAGGELLDWHKTFNTTVNTYRYVIERAIANFKVWRIMHTDYRRPLHTYATAFNAVRSLHFFKLSSA